MESIHKLKDVWTTRLTGKSPEYSMRMKPNPLIMAIRPMILATSQPNKIPVIKTIIGRYCMAGDFMPPEVTASENVISKHNAIKRKEAIRVWPFLLRNSK